MRWLRQRIFDVMAAMSLLALLASLVLYVRGQFAWDRLTYIAAERNQFEHNF